MLQKVILQQAVLIATITLTLLHKNPVFLKQKRLHRNYARKGDLAKLVKIAQELMSGFDSLDISCLK